MFQSAGLVNNLPVFFLATGASFLINPYNSLALYLRIDLKIIEEVNTTFFAENIGYCSWGFAEIAQWTQGILSKPLKYAFRMKKMSAFGNRIGFALQAN